MKFNQKYLSKFLPSFIRKPDPQPAKRRPPQPAREIKKLEPQPQIQRTAAQSTPAVNSAPANSQSSPILQPKPLEPPPNSLQMMDSITQFLRRYLVCDDYQLTVLALWSLYTWCFRHFPTAAYLHIRSAEQQSAKTLCLRLLSALCNSPCYIAGADSRSIMETFLVSQRAVPPDKPFISPPPYTFLIDNYHHILGDSERQRLLALFNCGSQAPGIYLAGRVNYSVFGPKAFAGNADLPRSLYLRCIPIVLKYKRQSEVVARFTPEAAKSASRLAVSLQVWAAANFDALASVAHQTPARLPHFVIPREQDCMEPLIHIADRIGGPWPDKARAALEAAFKLSAASDGMQLLSDLRWIFFVKNDPHHVPSKDLLSELRNEDNRPWGDWTSRSGRKLANLLKHFNINSHDFHQGSSTKYRGYLREDFLDAWERYLQPIPKEWLDYRSGTKH